MVWPAMGPPAKQPAEGPTWCACSAALHSWHRICGSQHHCTANRGLPSWGRYARTRLGMEWAHWCGYATWKGLPRTACTVEPRAAGSGTLCRGQMCRLLLAAASQLAVLGRADCVSPRPVAEARSAVDLSGLPQGSRLHLPMAGQPGPAEIRLECPQVVPPPLLTPHTPEVDGPVLNDHLRCWTVRRSPPAP